MENNNNRYDWFPGGEAPRGTDWEKYRKLDNRGLRVFVQEKVDGSNFAIRKNADGTVNYWSRNLSLDMETCDKPFKKLKLIEEEDYFQRMDTGVIYFGELLGMAKLPYNSTHKGNVYFFDILQDGNYMDPEYSNILFINKGMPCIPFEWVSINDLGEYLANEDKLSFIDNKTKIEGYVYRVGNYAYKKVNSVMRENFSKETLEPNKRYLEKWVQKWVVEEPVETWREFVRNCQQDFSDENPGCRMSKFDFHKKIEEFAEVVYTTIKIKGDKEDIVVPTGIKEKNND